MGNIMINYYVHKDILKVIEAMRDELNGYASRSRKWQLETNIKICEALLQFRTVEEVSLSRLSLLTGMSEYELSLQFCSGLYYQYYNYEEAYLEGVLNDNEIDYIRNNYLEMSSGKGDISARYGQVAHYKSAVKLGFKHMAVSRVNRRNPKDKETIYMTMEDFIKEDFGDRYDETHHWLFTPVILGEDGKPKRSQHYEEAQEYVKQRAKENAERTRRIYEEAMLKREMEKKSKKDKQCRRCER